MARGLSTLATSALVGLASARSLWSSVPAKHGWRENPDEYILKQGYPVGNGRLGAIPHGPPGHEKSILNIDSLWSGGPFQSDDYNGGNPEEPVNEALPGIRDNIFANGTGDVDELLGVGDYYGSYRTLGNLSISVAGSDDFTNYKRELDLKTGIHTTTYSTNDSSFETTVFCTYPDQVCVHSISTSGEAIPEVNVRFENTLDESVHFNLTCGEDFARITGYTQLGPPLGMKYDAIVKVGGGLKTPETRCSNGVLTISAPKGQKSLALVIGGDTNFDQSKGNADNEYSFRGEDPEENVERVTAIAAGKGFDELLESHLEDYQTLESSFILDLPDTYGSKEEETAVLLQDYSVEGDGNPFVEALLFDYARHLLVTSSRENSLPANLQGRWSEELYPAWSADYHTNINLQENYWLADQTGLGRTQEGLWRYMEENWVPRGTETAQLLYNASGWVVHNEANIFGHTGMKDTASWALYPIAPAWMMQHVWDNFEYTQNVTWLEEQGYPLIKGVAEFWLDQLVDDEYYNDGTLVVNPCNSAEHGPTTFGCTHYHQEIHRLFDTLLVGASIIGEADAEFLARVETSLEKLDKGVHLTEWGGLKEWKLPDSYGYDTENTHRHLSHLTGWFPGYSVSSYLGGFANETIQDAVTATLTARGNGTSGEGSSGWNKVWRSACWARLNNTDMAHFQLRYAIDLNFADNGFSMYASRNEPFQIDANFGLAGAILSMLVVDMPLPHDRYDNSRTVVLGPSIPSKWAGGSVKGLRIRGGGTVDFDWDDDGVVVKAKIVGSQTKVRLVNVKGESLA